MSNLYANCHRALQERYETRRLADRLEEKMMHDTFTDQDCAFIESRDMFFLSTVDPDGRPTVSYKGGPPGFIRVENNVLTFPCYDGNGMFYSIGNLVEEPKVGMLFIDFEKPIRLRVQGEAAIDDGPARAGWPGAMFLVRVKPTHIFPNCGRYIHQYKKVEQSRHVPDRRGAQPSAEWKRMDFIQDSLPERDKGAAAEAGAITFDEWLDVGES
jgi:predicted pyridoxine 5'-phosphate oxidase superfamily flavin-nucleotide-binding protein